MLFTNNVEIQNLQGKISSISMKISQCIQHNSDINGVYSPEGERVNNGISMSAITDTCTECLEST